MKEPKLTKEYYLKIAKTVHWSLIHGKEFEVVEEKSIKAAKKAGIIELSAKEEALNQINYFIEKEKEYHIHQSLIDILENIKQKVEIIKEEEVC